MSDGGTKCNIFANVASHRILHNIGGTHLQSTWQRYLESSSRANACIWLALACTHNTAITGVQLHHFTSTTLFYMVHIYNQVTGNNNGVMRNYTINIGTFTSVGKEHTETKKERG